ncbi:pdrg1 prefoldin-like subunit [Lycorma delicatula]|uniref:pdrg1 prefoldin-like subunit n=1 Tax=Lycorma delicatula TaxID=130591 RepID=UPI003F513CCD
MENPMRSLAHLQAVEEQAEEILRDRSEIVALDRRRNGNREALRALQKQNSKSTWFALGSMLVKLPVDKAKNLLEKDQQVTSSEINKLRSDLKVKVNDLRDLEFESPVPGLMLQPLTRDEMSAVGQTLGRHVT